MIAVLDLEFADRVDRSQGLSGGDIADDGKGRKRFARVIDNALGDTTSA